MKNSYKAIGIIAIVFFVWGLYSKAKDIMDIEKVSNHTNALASLRKYECAQFMFMKMMGGGERHYAEKLYDLYESHGRTHAIIEKSMAIQKYMWRTDDQKLFLSAGLGS